MANIFKQTVLQDTTEIIPKRMIVQYVDDATGEQSQVIVDYDSLSAGDKTTFDNFVNLSTTKIP